MVAKSFLYLQVITSLIALVAAQAGQYQQCGGIGWTGATTCVSGWTCTKLNDYYYQCLQGATSASSSSSTSTPSGPSSSSSSSSAPSSSSSSSSAPASSQTASNISPEWAAAYAKAKAAVANLSVADKVNLGTGVQWQKGPCVGNIPAISSIPGFTGLCLQDGPVGVRYADKVSVFPPEINVAATWNRTLMRQRGAALGAEFKGKGAHVALGPMMNLMRAPAAGRNWEGGGGDPFLSGELAFETVTGIQSSGAQACAKHYINNEQEHFRDSSSSIVDDRTQHELYLHPFLRSVQANVATVMCSYSEMTGSLVNGSYACENDKTLNGLLKGELGFQGCTSLSRYWWATHSGAPAVNAGLDMTMPGDETYESGTTYFGQNLVNAVNSGQVSQARLTDLATRILAAWYLLGQDSGFPAVNYNSWNPSQGKHIDVSADHATLIRTIGAASTVLLKNTNGTLPLAKPKSIGIIGNGAGSNPQGPNGFTDRAGDSGVLALGWGSGTADFPYLTAPVDAITARAKQDGTTITSSLSDTDLNGAANAAAGKDVAFVFITADSGEGYLTVENNAGDRNDLSAWHGGDALIAQVAKTNKNTVVVVNSVGPINTEAWVNHPNVTAIVWSGLPGQEAGNSLVDVLYGAYNPSGKLPFTIGKSINDYAAQIITSGSGIVPIPYNEGLFIDYRHFDQANIAPRFEFGFGLSYTTFSYSNLKISGSTSGGTRQPKGPGSSLDPWLHTPVVTVTFTLTNTGTVAGTEIPQLYISPPSTAKSAPNNLKGFDSVFLAAGASTTVSLSLTRYHFSIWDVVSQQWLIPSGVTGISVGASSRDLRLKGSITN
ncbi:beta-glucosidase [Trametopsis cervina]|nr:beta-glucosidase [Trametopsis cervina]